MRIIINFLIRILNGKNQDFSSFDSVLKRRKLLDRLGILFWLKRRFTKEKLFIEYKKRKINGTLIVNHQQSENLIFYLHGGGFVYGSDLSHLNLVSRISHNSKCDAFLLNYSLSPENNFPEAIDDAVVFLDYYFSKNKNKKIKEYKKIFVGGDSAGGYLTLSLMQKLKKEKKRFPDKIFAISPATSLDFNFPSYTKNKDVDILLSPDLMNFFCKAYLGSVSKDSKNFILYPINEKKFNHLPRCLIIVGEDEIMYDDSFLYFEKANQNGGKVELRVYKKMWHVFLAYAPLLKEANWAIQEIGHFLQKRED